MSADWMVGGDPHVMAENYARHLVPAIFSIWTSETLQHLQARPGDTVLDVACGTGVATFEVARLVGPHARVVGIDSHTGMLTIADRIRKGRTMGNVSFREMDARNIMYPDGVFDRLICQHALMYMEDKPKAVREMYRVLSPGGRMVITGWSTRHSNPHEAMLADVFRAHLGEEPAFFEAVFSVGDRGAMEAVLRAAGVKGHALVERVQRRADFPSIEAYWQGMVYGRPVVAVMQGLPERTRADIKEETIESLMRFKSNDVRGGFLFPMEAVIVTVVKP